MKNEKKVKKRSALLFKPYPLSPTYRILGMHRSVFDQHPHDNFTIYATQGNDFNFPDR